MTDNIKEMIILGIEKQIDTILNFQREVTKSRLETKLVDVDKVYEIERRKSYIIESLKELIKVDEEE